MPLSILTRTLNAIQQAVFDAGESLVGEQAPRRAGRRPAIVEESCGLDIVAIRTGTVSANLTIREPSPHLIEEEDDLGEQAVDVVLEVLDALSSDQPARQLRRAVANASYRQRILTDLETAAPRAGERFRLTLLDPRDAGRRFTFDAGTRELIGRARYQPEEDVRSVIGDMVQLRVFEPRSFHIRRQEREIRCTYATEMQDVVLASIGQTVAVRGRVVLDERDQIRSMDEVFDVEPVDVSPRRMERVTHGGRTLRLSPPLTVRPTVIEDAVVVELSELGVVSYGETSDDALESLVEDLFWVWDEYAQASDEELTADAIDLKERAREWLEDVSAEGA